MNKNESASFLLRRKKSITLEIDLSADEQMIFAKFSKQVRNCIRQAGKMGVDCYFDKDSSKFKSFFNAFATEKGMAGISISLLDKLKDNLYISFAEYQGKVYAAHCTIVDFETGHAFLFKSASQRLIDKNLCANDIGKANKMLHYYDLLYFKRLGVKTYEFGGYSNDGESDPFYGVNRFKSHFGGQIGYSYRYETIPYFIIQIIKTNFKKIKLY